jgi:hypothetical protein
MKNAKRISLVLLALGVVTVCVTATRALAAGPVGGCNPHTLCPDIVAPVLCPNGKVYINSCFAAKACQTNCTPYGAF